MLPPPQDSPLDLLRSCHAKMRQFSVGLERVVAAHAAGDPRAAESAPIVARYFREALPNHAADEDESLTPRLVQLDLALAALLARLAEEHRHLDVLLPVLCADLDRLGTGEALDAAAFAERAAGVVGLLRERAGGGGGLVPARRPDSTRGTACHPAGDGRPAKAPLSARLSRPSSPRRGGHPRRRPEARP